MIDEKKINIAAKKYADTIYIVFNYRILRRLIFRTFVYAINWFLRELWHDVSEEPIRTRKESEYVECLVQFKDGMVNLYNYDTWHHWWVCDTDNEVFLEKISRWLYIEDLLKGGK